MMKKLLSSVQSLSSDEGEISISIDSEKSNDNLKKWQSIRTSYAIMFFTSISYSIQMTSVWPYMNIINPEYSKEFLGWVVGSFSIGQLIACPIFTIFSGKTGYFKLNLLIAALLASGGNYLYSIIVDINGSYQTIALVASRVIIGISGANVATVRLFLTVVTSEEERIGPMSILSSCQALGFIIGPGLQAAFVPLGYPGLSTIPFLRVNMYTASAFFGILSNMTIFFILLFLFKDVVKNQKRALNKSLSSDSGNEFRKIDVDINPQLFINDYFCGIFMLVAFFICMMSLSILETSSTPMSMDNFGWSRSEATLINSIILASTGICSILVYICLRFLVKKIKEKYILVTAFGIIVISAIFLIPMGKSKIPLQIEEILFNKTSTNIFNNATGCNSHIQHWCLHVPALEIWQYGVSLFFFTIGYPSANVLSYVIFSRLIDPNAQSLWMGLLTSSGSLARIVGPVGISNLYENYGTQVAFISWTSVLFLFLMSTPLFLWKISKTENYNSLRKPINE